MSRQPVVNSDTGTWGDVLNDYLSVAHNGDGTFKNAGARQQLKQTAQLSTSTPQLIGRDPATGRTFWITSSGGSQLWDSPDDGATMSINRTLPAGGVIWNFTTAVVSFNGKLYLLGVDTAGSNVGGIWETTPDFGAAATWTWTRRWTAATGANNVYSTGLSTDGTYLYVTEAGDPTGGPQVYRSSNGSSFSSVLGPLTGNRHAHAIEPDPYNAGHVYLTLGDGGNKFLMRSTDYGANWTTIIDNSLGSWVQGLQISFDANRIYIASDSTFLSAIYLDRSDLVPRSLCPNYHGDLEVPIAIPRAGGSVFADGTFNSGTTGLVSASATFVSSDVGRSVFSDRLPSRDVYIASVTNGTTVVLSQNANASGSGRTFYLGGSRWPPISLVGAVDPATSIYYAVSIDTNTMENPWRGGIFYTPGVGQPLQLYQMLSPVNGIAVYYKTFIFSGKVWNARWNLPLFAR